MTTLKATTLVLLSICFVAVLYLVFQCHVPGNNKAGLLHSSAFRPSPV